MFRLELPLEPREGENLQSLINEHFRVKDEQRKQMVQCPHEGCTSRVARFSVSELLDPKAAIVFFVNRQQNNPVWAQPFFRDLPAEEQANCDGFVKAQTEAFAAGKTDATAIADTMPPS